MSEWRVVEITAGDTHPLRLAVLRQGTPTTDVTFDEDGWPGVEHLGVHDDGVLVGTSTWIPRGPDIQLRGMATAATHQGRGVGTALVRAGLERAAAHNGECTIWANARDAALGFYLAHGFVVVGEGFVDAVTALPHHRVTARTRGGR